MRTYRWVVVLAVVLSPSPALAEQTARAGAALVRGEGEVYLDDRIVDANSAPSPLPPVVLRTGRGRAAIALKRGGLLLLDSDTSVRVLHNGFYNFNRIEVLAGSAIVMSGTSAPLVECESDIRLSDAGTFRFDIRHERGAAESTRCQFRVFDGSAAVPLASVTDALRAGQMMRLLRECGDHNPNFEFSREQLDDFDQWARRMRAQLGN